MNKDRIRGIAEVIKTDDFGLREGMIHTPAVVIISNQIPSIPQELNKRIFTVKTSATIESMDAFKNGKEVNRAVKGVTNALFCEFIGRMIPLVQNMIREMERREDDKDYDPDFLQDASECFIKLLSEYINVDDYDYIKPMKYDEWGSDLALSKEAAEKFMTLWNNEPGQFRIDRKSDKLVYSHPDPNRSYELRDIANELPIRLGADVTGRELTVSLSKAEEFFKMKFKKPWFKR